MDIHIRIGPMAPLYDTGGISVGGGEACYWGKGISASPVVASRAACVASVLKELHAPHILELEELSTL